MTATLLAARADLLAERYCHAADAAADTSDPAHEHYAALAADLLDEYDRAQEALGAMEDDQ